VRLNGKRWGAVRTGMRAFNIIPLAFPYREWTLVPNSVFCVSVGDRHRGRMQPPRWRTADSSIRVVEQYRGCYDRGDISLPHRRVWARQATLARRLGSARALSARRRAPRSQPCHCSLHRIDALQAIVSGRFGRETSAQALDIGVDKLGDQRWNACQRSPGRGAAQEFVLDRFWP